MILEIEKKKGVLPKLKANGKGIDNVTFINRYFCQHSKSWKTVFEVTEVKASSEVPEPVKKKKTKKEIPMEAEIS